MERDLRDIKEEVRAKTDIVEIISGYTQLKRSGKNWTGLCPFHADKNPSFSVSPSTQSYRCWSCGEKGDVFNFVQKKQNIDFMEALEDLAKRAGVAFERRGLNPEIASEREQMRELNRLAVQFYQERLSHSDEARDYLANRAILKPTQDQFEIGFAANEWEGLTFFLQRRKADITLAAKMGLIKIREKERGGGYYDTYRNRVMFPIHDLQGDVIGFGGRAMDPNEKAKYINSEQSALFDKSSTLYGLFFARKGKLSEERPPVFVEGYVDVITAHQAGFTQCVATLGTSMTEEHARILARYSKRVVICYDADNAGISATLRGATVWESVGPEGAEVRVARLPLGEDPDSLLKRGDTAAFQAALDTAVPRVDFQIEIALRRHDLKTDFGKENALAEVIPILASIRSLTQRDRHAQNLAYLHPSSQYNLSRAIESILADVAMYARQSDGAQSPRDRGYPRTGEANGAPLQEQPPPPSYRPPSRERWGQFDPNTRNIIRKGDGSGQNGYGGGNGQGSYGNNQSGYPRNGGGDYGGKSGGGNGRWKDRYPPRPQSDPTPPPLDTPALSGAHKAERTLLRALLAPETRANLLAQLDPKLLPTPRGQGLFAYIARTPANAEGGIDPLPLLRRIEMDEEEEDTKEESAEKKGNSDSESEPVWQESWAQKRSTKISEYLRDLLEDSRSVMSNEPLNEVV
ncbi:MAG: primase, catalytic core, partial [Chthonomonadaceae bacterium]|nr:primase, catalytic core [Chthonomonadaceae bacterium]